MAKFTTEIKRTIIASLQLGNYQEVACKLSGVSTSTFRRWLQKGEQEEAGEYFEFKLDVDRAIAQAEAGLVSYVSVAAETDHKAALELLARRFPQRWSSSSRVNLQVEKHLESVLTALETKLPKEVFDQVILALVECDELNQSEND